LFSPQPALSGFSSSLICWSCILILFMSHLYPLGLAFCSSYKVYLLLLPWSCLHLIVLPLLSDLVCTCSLLGLPVCTCSCLNMMADSPLMRTQASSVRTGNLCEDREPAQLREDWEAGSMRTWRPGQDRENSEARPAP
jgi:hypothetical protein